MSYNFAFFVLAQISAPVSRHGWRLWQMEALACRFDLPKSRLRASHWHLQLIKTSFWLFSGHYCSLFCVFFCVCQRWLVLANGSSGLELRFAIVSAQGEPLALRSDQNKFFGYFLSFFAHFSVFRSRAGWFGSG